MQERVKLGRPKLPTPTGVSREAIRQRQKNALRKARRILRDKGFKAEDFFDLWRRRI
jgi:DNA-directed RNA polymerase sigma subunit (sigma70/sigma32)